MISVARLKKNSISCRSTDFGQFLLPRSDFKVHFLNLEKEFQKSLERLQGDVVSIIVFYFELSISSGLWGGGGASRFASGHFPKSVSLASCDLVERLFVAYYACSIVKFHSP